MQLVSRVAVLFSVGATAVLLGGCAKKNVSTTPAGGSPVLVAAATPPPSALTAQERQYLLWFLLRRDEAGLPSMSVKHVMTTQGSCSSCAVIFFSWGSPATYARIAINETGVVSAADTSGYDYLLKTQGSPVRFSDLSL